MLNLIKYEFRKQAFSKGVLLLLVGLIELLFFIGIAATSNKLLTISMVLLISFTWLSMFFIAFESILTFSNDLKNKCSYMLFLTPNTSFSIVGAKIIAAAAQIILASIAIFGVFALNGGVLLAKFASINEIKRVFTKLLKDVFQLEVNIPNLISVIVLLIVLWLCTLTIAFFSISLSSTFLANKKYKGIVSFVIFVLINVSFYYLEDKIFGYKTDTSDFAPSVLIQSLFMLVLTGLTYVGTAWMLEKKVSV